MKNRTIKSAVFNQLGKNYVIKHNSESNIIYKNKNCVKVFVRMRRNTADFIGIESSEKSVYLYKNIFGFYKIVR